MRRRLKILANLGLLLLSVVTTFYALSLADRALGPLVTHKLWPGRMGLVFAPNTEDHFATFDYRCAEYINGLGFRDRETPLVKTCKYRIIAIGDSFTYGWGVNIEDAWCRQLERNLRAQGVDVEVLNLGKPAAGPKEYAAIAESIIPVLKPDLVLVGVLAGDDLQQVGLPDLKGFFVSRFTNSLQLVRYWRYRDYYLGPVKTAKRTEEECRAFNARTAKELVDGMDAEQRARFDKIEEQIRRVFLEGNLNPWLLNHSTSGPDYFVKSLKPEALGYQIWMVSNALERIRKAARRTGAGVAVVSIPEGFFVNREAYANLQRIGFQTTPEMLQSNAADDAVGEACKRRGIPFHAVSDQFREHIDEKGLYFELDRHFTAKGNLLYGDLVTPFVAEELRRSREAGR